MIALGYPPFIAVLFAVRGGEREKRTLIAPDFCRNALQGCVFSMVLRKCSILYKIL